jgi:hypothetical protein
MSCTIHTVNYNSTTHSICPLTFMAYKYNELQMSSTIQKLSCKASYKTPFSHSVFITIILKLNFKQCFRLLG